MALWSLHHLYPDKFDTFNIQYKYFATLIFVFDFSGRKSQHKILIQIKKGNQNSTIFIHNYLSCVRCLCMQ